MKLLLTAIVLVATVVAPSKCSEDSVSEMNKINVLRKCADQSNASISDLSAMVNEAKKSNLPENREFYCYFACLALESGAYVEGGAIDIAKVNNWFPPHVRGTKDAFLKKCDTEDNRKIPDICDREYDLARCLVQADSTIMVGLQLIP